MQRFELDESALRSARDLSRAVAEQVSRAFIGPGGVAELLLSAIVARGHVLIEGVPGVAKTTLAKALATATGCSFARVQFTPDLLPADITGTYVLDMHKSEFVLHPGPIFANVVLGDEINRAPAKTQAALLEAMQEGQVTIDGDTRQLGAPFVVLATQNPMEHEGTYPLPDAQIDRFLLKLHLGYPGVEDELRMLATYGAAPPERPEPAVQPSDILRLQALADATHAGPEILEYILALVRYTREHPRVHLGASPRAALALLHTAKSLALLRGRGFVLPDDIQELAPRVLSHRIVQSTDAELGGQRPESIVAEALANTAYQRPLSAASER